MVTSEYWTIIDTTHAAYRVRCMRGRVWLYDQWAGTYSEAQQLSDAWLKSKR